jgi:hypothetical protein
MLKGREDNKKKRGKGIDKGRLRVLKYISRLGCVS